MTHCARDEHDLQLRDGNGCLNVKSKSDHVTIGMAICSLRTTPRYWNAGTLFLQREPATVHPP